MIAVTKLFDEVKTSVTALNGEIVRRAFQGHCCEFVNNQTEFARLLKAYIDHRMMIHRLRAEENRAWELVAHTYDTPRLHHLRDHLRPNHHSILHHHAQDAIWVRMKLKEIWPCVACVHLYNPTKRQKNPQLA